MKVQCFDSGGIWVNKGKVGEKMENIGNKE